MTEAVTLGRVAARTTQPSLARGRTGRAALHGLLAAGSSRRFWALPRANALRIACRVLMLHRLAACRYYS